MLFAKYGKLELAPNEVNSYPLSSVEVGMYDACCYTSTENIFLNRCIINQQEDYVIFIAVSEVLMQGDFETALKNDPAITVKASRSEVVSKTKVNGYLLSKNERQFVRYTYIEPKSGLLVIYDYACADAAKLDDLYNHIDKYLHEKIDF